MTHLFCFGMGFSARVLAGELAAQGWRTGGTTRSQDKRAEIEALGHEGFIFSGTEASAEVAKALQTATHVLISISPGDSGDRVLAHFREAISKAPQLEWIGYLSTIGVYGDFGGAWIDETAVTEPASARGQRRVVAEADWLALGREIGRPVQVFRLAGIYGPGSSPLHKVRAGTAKRIVKPGQVFNRIHVEDIAGAVMASIAKPNNGAIYNVVDDEPAPPQDVVAHAAAMLGLEPPPAVAYDDAEMTPMARSFYGEVKRVSNARLKEELGYQLKYPTFREGLQRVMETMDGV